MGDYKHICDFNYCKTHQVCLYKNATAVLKNHPCKARVGQEVNANIIVCYQNRLDTSIYANDSDSSWIFEMKLRENRNKASQPHCQNPKCNSVAETRFNGEILLCFKCVDSLREWKTNYELGTIYKNKEKILKLFKLIEELSPKKEPNRDMVRCSNIYCGTLDNMTKHHLIPKPFRNGETVPKIPLCEDCHKKVHQLATNQELAEKFNTKQSVVELLSKDITFRKERFMIVFENNLMAVA